MESVLDSHTVCESCELSHVRIGPYTTAFQTQLMLGRTPRTPKGNRAAAGSDSSRLVFFCLGAG